MKTRRLVRRGRTVFAVASILWIASTAWAIDSPLGTHGVMRGADQEGRLAARESCTRCTTGIRFEFVSEMRAEQLLGRRDEYTRTISAVDMGLRMRTTDSVGLDTFLTFNREHARGWSDEEIAAWEPVLADLDRAMAGLDIRVQRTVIAKTTGEQELGSSAYTRGRTIYLREDLAWLPVDDPRAAFFLLAHEVFHVVSRFDPHLRDELYELIGFSRFIDFFDRFDYPATLENGRMTNPDGTDYHHTITVETPDGIADVVPIVQLAVPLAEAIAVPNPFDVIAPVLLAIDRADGTAALDSAGDPVLYPFNETNYVGLTLRNTGFIVQPDEILADNFALLMEALATGQIPAANPGGFPVNDVELLRSIHRVLETDCGRSAPARTGLR